MLPPGGSGRYRDNPNAPQIRFIKRNGRVIPIINRVKKVLLAPVVEGRLLEMMSEVKHAQQGLRGVATDLEHGGSVKNFATMSTYPKWYSQIGFKNKDHFLSVAHNEKSKKFDSLTEQAIRDLKSGYDSPYGRVPPDMKFRVATKQTYDNKGVIFRKIDGTVRPIRIQHKTIKSSEVPF